MTKWSLVPTQTVAILRGRHPCKGGATSTPALRPEVLVCISSTYVPTFDVFLITIVAPRPRSSKPMAGFRRKVYVLSSFP